MRRALAAVALAVLLAGCGEDEPQRTTLVWEAAGTPSAAELERAAEVLQVRIDALAKEGIGMRTVAPNRIEVRVDSGEAERIERDRSLTGRGRIALYDWEANVVGDARIGGCYERPEAQRRAGRVRGPVVLLRSEPLESGAPRNCWYVLRDRPALTSADILSPEQLVDPQTNEPIVAFQFTARGRARFQAVTRTLARRGQRRSATTPVDRAQQHFAIARDDQILSVPFIDYTANPNGIDARNGSQISGGLTTESAGLLAAQMRSGELTLRLRRVDS
ncbi:MAG TPA: hypothetical protein VFZ89_14215 [Solirubrobacteraceae bacterium]